MQAEGDTIKEVPLADLTRSNSKLEEAVAAAPPGAYHKVPMADAQFNAEPSLRFNRTSGCR
jgi:hypothetical protein